jgi:hypothetical protein
VSRKPRCDCKPLKLIDADQQQLFEWIKLLGFEKARLKAIDDLGHTFSIGSLHNAYHYWMRADSENRIFQAVTGADAIIDAAADNLPKINHAMEAMLNQAAFEAVLSKDPEAIKTLVELTLKVSKAGMEEKALQLQIDRFQFDAAKAAMKHAAELKSIAGDKGMSNDAKIDAVRRRLFGSIPEDSNG